MEPWNWTAIAAISEALGVAGLIASLIFVGVQMKQTAISLRITANHGIQEAFRDTVMRLANDESLAEIFHKEIPKPGSIEGLQEFRFALMNQAVIQMYANAHYQYSVGALNENTWGSIDAQLGNWMKTPGIRSYWETRGRNFPKEFERYINSEVMKSPIQEDYRTAGT